MCSVQSSLLFLYYVVFSRVMSVQYYLCVSRISVHSVQCQSIASAQFYSVQCKQCSESVQFLKHSVYRAESVVYIVSGIQCQLGYSLRRSWSAYYSSVSGVFSLVFGCQWGSESIAFSDSLVSVAFRVCTVQWVILRLYSSVSAVFRALAVQSCHVQSPHLECPLPLRSS